MIAWTWSSYFDHNVCCSLIFFFICFAFMLLLVPKHSFERCDFMQRKSTDDNVWVRSLIMLLLLLFISFFCCCFFLHSLLYSQFKQIFSHKSSIASHCNASYAMLYWNKKDKPNKNLNKKNTHTHWLLLNGCCSNPNGIIHIHWNFYED